MVFKNFSLSWSKRNKKFVSELDFGASVAEMEKRKGAKNQRYDSSSIALLSEAWQHASKLRNIKRPTLNNGFKSPPVFIKQHFTIMRCTAGPVCRERAGGQRHGEKAQRSSDSVLFVYIAATFNCLRCSWGLCSCACLSSCDLVSYCWRSLSCSQKCLSMVWSAHCKAWHLK